MSEVTRFKMEFQPEGVVRECVYASDYDAAQSELSALREELAAHKYKSELYDEVWPKATGMGFMNITMALAEIPRLQQRLTAAEERNAQLVELLRESLEEDDGTSDWLDRVVAALRDKPTESGASE